MRAYGRFFWMGSGLALGLIASALFFHNQQTALASSNDRFEDYVMCTGAVAVTGRAPTDGLWVLDYRRGKLMGTVIDRSRGKIIGWADVDLIPEFGVQPRQNVHFMMTTGNTAQGQAALYVLEVISGKLGVYTLQPAVAGNLPFAIVRHDMNGIRDNFNAVGGIPSQVIAPANGAAAAADAGHKANLLPFVGPNKGGK